MENYRLIRPEHLNHYGFLFGGYLLMWVDEVAWLAVSREFPDHRFVTVGMDDVAFKKSVKEGTILKFEVIRAAIGTTSVTYSVSVTDKKTEIFSTQVSLVRINNEGVKTAIEKK